MVVLSDCVRIETDFEFQLLFGLQCSFGNFYIEYSIFFNFIIFEVPVNIFFINVTDSNRDKFGVASVRFSNYFSLEIYH